MARILIILILFLNLTVKSLPYIIYQGNNQALYIENLSDKSSKKLTDDACGQFVGYDFRGDALNGYYEIQGRAHSISQTESEFALFPMF